MKTTCSDNYVKTKPNTKNHKQPKQKISVNLYGINSEEKSQISVLIKLN